MEIYQRMEVRKLMAENPEEKEGLSKLIDKEEYDRLSLPEKWMYLNERMREIDERVRRLTEKK